MAPVVLLAGGGINGMGVFRDLARQGVPTLLIEKGDFASGTSAAPSRLIHGGLRYLETGEFALVRESVEERNLLLLNAPHVVRPLRIWVPAKNWLGGAVGAIARFLRLTKTPGPKGIAVVKLGLMIYDLFGKYHQTMPNHRLVSRAETARTIPGLGRDVKAVAEYYDARIWYPERLTLELAGDAEADCPDAMALPYVSVAGNTDGKVILRDELTGEEKTVAPRIVVNCTGAWADRVNAAVGIDSNLIGGTKGTHLILDDARMARELGDVMLYFPTSDNRACLIYAFDERHVLLGATDIRCDEPENVATSDEEVDYLFAVIREVLPACRFSRDNIAFAICGVRPLPRSEGDVAGAISRDHSIKAYPRDSARPYDVLTLVGGKWTTFRACGEQIADKVLSLLEKTRRESTKHLAIGGGRNFPKSKDDLARRITEIAAASKASIPRVTELYERYGTSADAYLASLGGAAENPLQQVPGYSVEEIRYIAASERVTRLSDVVMRRTLIALGGHASESAVAEVAAIVAQPLDWEAARMAEEIALTHAELRGRHRVPKRP
ncbi:glycerol-3-phosphate dehydrogenase/oxidase [soil metagenome]